MPIELEYPTKDDMDTDLKETLASIHESEQ
jgi:hypothetical protein